MELQAGDMEDELGEKCEEISMYEKDSRNWWAISLVTIITLARVGHGLFMSVTGPTLLYLAENTNSDVSQVSIMFTGRSSGVLIGAFIFSGIMNQYPTFKPLVSSAWVMAINGLVMIVTPWCRELWLLVFVSTIGGMCLGYTDCGLQAAYLKIWGEKESRPYIQSFHFGFSIGAFLAPILARPFLLKASEEVDEPNCPQTTDYSTTLSPFTNNYGNYTTTDVPYTGINPTAWTFVIIGGYMVLTAIALLIIALLNVEERLETMKVESLEDRTEEPLRDVYIFFTPVVFYYVCCVSSEAIFQSYIYAIAICSELNFTVSQASRLNTMFWAGFVTGRATGIFFSNYFDPKTIIIVDLIGTISGMIIMVIWGEYIVIITWIISFSHGLFVATLYSSGVSWTSRETNMAGSYMVVFAIGNALGGMAMVPAGGVIYENDPFNTMYLIFGTCVANAIFFAAMVWIAHQRHVAVESQLKEDQEHNYYVNQSFAVSLTKM